MNRESDLLLVGSASKPWVQPVHPISDLLRCASGVDEYHVPVVKEVNNALDDLQIWFVVNGAIEFASTGAVNDAIEINPNTFLIWKHRPARKVERVLSDRYPELRFFDHSEFSLW